MVRRLISGLFLLLSTAASAAPQLQLVVDKDRVQIGHHIDATLYGIDLATRLGNLDLSALNQYFGVELLESSEADGDAFASRWPKQHVQSLAIKLYPRSVGTLTIPAFTIAGTHSQAKTIQVTDSVHNRSNTRIEREFFISTKQPWERQQVRIEYIITSAEKFASLDADRPDIAGFEIYPLPALKKTIKREGKFYTRLRSGWVLFPLTSGSHVLDLPPITYRQSGRILRTFYLPAQTLTVKALPPYIPPTMPVGKVALTSVFETDSLLFPDHLYYWQLFVSGQGVSPNWLPPVMQQIKSNDSLRVLPKDSRHELTFSHDGLQSQAIHHIPFKASTSGRLALPELRIQFFNPVNGKIENLEYKPKTPYALSMSWRALLAGIFLLLLLRGSYLFYQWLSRTLRRHQLRRRAFQNIKTASTVTDIRHALGLLSQAENWPLNLTMREWAHRWQNQYRVDTDFDSALQLLSQACYQTHRPTDIKALRDSLARQLANS